MIYIRKTINLYQIYSNNRIYIGARFIDLDCGVVLNWLQDNTFDLAEWDDFIGGEQIHVSQRNHVSNK